MEFSYQISLKSVKWLYSWHIRIWRWGMCFILNVHPLTVNTKQEIIFSVSVAQNMELRIRADQFYLFPENISE
jgi:hypothetical protein